MGEVTSIVPHDIQIRRELHKAQEEIRALEDSIKRREFTIRHLEEKNYHLQKAVFSMSAAMQTDHEDWRSEG